MLTRDKIITQILPSAILAPSAHNTQPWYFSARDNQLDISPSPGRHLSVSDPTSREMYISLGCAAMNCRVTAAHQGYITNSEYLIDSKIPIQLSFKSGQANKHLAKLHPAIKQRRSDRGLYNQQPLSGSEKKDLKSIYESHVTLVEDRQQIEQIAQLTGQGSYQTLARADFKKELSHWVRSNWTKQPDGMPGYAIGIPAPLTPFLPIIVRIAPIHKQEQTNTAKQIRSSSALAIILTESDGKKDWIEAGQLLEQIWLEITDSGLSAAVLAAAIEGSEGLRHQVRTTLQTDKYPQAIIRFGHSPKKSVKASPRRTVQNCLKH